MNATDELMYRQLICYWEGITALDGYIYIGCKENVKEWIVYTMLFPEPLNSTGKHVKFLVYGKDVTVREGGEHAAMLLEKYKNHCVNRQTGLLNLAHKWSEVGC